MGARWTGAERVQRRLSTTARRRQSGAELNRLDADVRGWLEHRRRHDPREQYASQLRAVETFVDGAVVGLRRGLDRIDLTRPAADVYGECRAFDLRVAWLRRVWEYFREKFDQRDVDELKDVLAAADEVVWSCYRQVVDRAQLAGLPMDGPAPLPFIEPYYSPEAFPAELVPSALWAEVDPEFAREHLNRLPIPVVRLHPACVRSPWWLIYLGHEVGHHVQYALLQRMRLVAEFRTLVVDAVHAAGASEADGKVWGRWSPEIFADICSVLFMGQWALGAMVELELQGAAAMAQRRTAYPAPAVRLLILRDVTIALGLDAGEPLGDVDLSALISPDETAAADAALVPAVVGAALAMKVDDSRTLKDLTGFMTSDYDGEGEFDRWSERLRSAQAAPDKSLRMPRVLASAGLAAWARADGDGSDLPTLASCLTTVVTGCGPEDTRAGETSETDATALGGEFADLLSAWGPPA